MTKAGALLTLGRMFNLGLPELILIGAAALLVFGPRRLPELAKGLGKGIRDFKKALEGNEEKNGESQPNATTAPTETLPPGGTVAQEAKKVPGERTKTGDDDRS